MLQPVQDLVLRISAVIINPLLALIFGAGFIVFVWGLIQYLYALNIKGDADNIEGKQHMLWGIVGMLIMVAAFAIIRIIANTINVQLPGGY